MIRRRVIVRGLVQGVYFRDTVQRRALASGISGWMRNNPDGTVEGVFEGDRGAVERLVSFCRDGPRGAVVDDIAVFDEEPEVLTGFAIR